MFGIYLPPPPSLKSNLLICYGPQSGIDEDSSKIYFYRIWIIDFHDFVIIPNAEPWTAVNKKKIQFDLWYTGDNSQNILFKTRQKRDKN